MNNIQEQIELLLHDFEIRLSDDTSATLLLQLQINNIRYLKHFGDLNNLAGCTMTFDSAKDLEDLDFYAFFANEIELLPVAESTKKNHRDTLRLLHKFKEKLCFSQLNYELLTSFDYYLVKSGYAVNTIARQMKVLKQYINRAIVLEYIQTTHLKSIRYVLPKQSASHYQKRNWP